MSRYVPLLRVEVAHDFHAGAPVPGLRFEPTARTQALLQQVDAVVRATAEGLIVLGDVDRLPDDADPEQALCWRVHADDAAFINVTDGLGRCPHELWWFRAAEAVSEPDAGGWRLHAAARAGRADVRQADDAELRSVLGQPLRLPVPVAVLSLPIASWRAAAAAGPVVYRVRLAARATVWRYCFVGNWHDALLRVVDLAREAVFEPPEPVQLADGRSALAVRSSAPLALSQRSGRRFQLRSPDANGKVLVKRLPVASPHHFAREPIDGVPTWVSDIFVHR